MKMKNGRLAWASVLGLGVLLLSGCGPLTWCQDVVQREYPAPLLLGAPVQGQVPLLEVLRVGKMSGVLVAWPELAGKESVQVVVRPESNWAEVVSATERATDWVYDCVGKRFVGGSATHTIDSPDAAGRSVGGDRLSLDSRAQVSLRVRFVTGAAGLSEAEIFGSGQAIDFSGSVPAGVQASWGSSVERSYTSGIRDAGSDNGTVVETSRSTVPAGVICNGLVGLLPGGRARIDAHLEVSSFVGNGLEKAAVTVPLQGDFPRWQWIPVMRLSQADARVRLAFADVGLNSSFGASVVVVYVRAD